MNAASPMSVQQPLTYLFVPGNRPERFAKALASGADRVILDLEDAVAPDDKAKARGAIADWVGTLTLQDCARLLVRINDVTSPWHVDDVFWLQSSPISHVMLSKCESQEQVERVLTHMPPGSSVLPLIETVHGVLAANAIAPAKHVERLGFGSLDYLLDLDLPGPGFALDSAALAIAMASRAADLPPPGPGSHPSWTRARCSVIWPTPAPWVLGPRCVSTRPRWPWCARPSRPTRKRSPGPSASSPNGSSPTG